MSSVALRRRKAPPEVRCDGESRGRGVMVRERAGVRMCVANWVRSGSGDNKSFYGLRLFLRGD